MARLAAEKGYQATGIDSDPLMIRAANRIAQRQGLSINFKTGDMFNLPKESAEVISAASLLAVLGNKTSGLKSLWNCVRPGGILLIIEPTNQMTLDNANQLIKAGLPRKRIQGLRMWATARQGNIINPAIIETLEAIQSNLSRCFTGLLEHGFSLKKV